MHGKKYWAMIKQDSLLTLRLRPDAVFFRIFGCWPMIVMLTALLFAPTRLSANTTIVRVGVYDNPPLVAGENGENITGFAIDILRFIAEQEGWQLEFVHGSWSECLQRLRSGDIDLQVAIACSTGRAGQINFSQETLIINWGRLFRKSGSKIESILDLEEKTIGILENDIHGDAFADILQQFTIAATLVRLDNYDRIFQGIAEGDIDCGVVNRLYAMQNQHRFKVEPTPLVFNPIEVRYAAPKGKNQNLLLAIDHHLRTLKADKNSLYFHAQQYWFNGRQHWPPPFPLWFKVTLLIGTILFFIAIAVALLLKSQVRLRTTELVQRNMELKEKEQQLVLEIEQRKSAENELTVNMQALRKSEARYANLFSNNHTVMLLVDPEDGTIVEANPAACTYYGYSYDELQSMNISDINLLTKQEIQQEMELAKQKQRTTFHFRHRLKNGEIRDVEVFSGPIELNDHLLLCSIIHDISARVAAEEEVRNSKQQWERTFHSFTDVVTLQDPFLRIIKINRAGCRLLEKSCEDLVGHHCYELFRGSDEACMQCPLLLAQQTFQPYSREIFYERLGKTFLVSAAPVLDSNGNLEFIAHVAKDITGWKKMEQRLFQNEKMTTIAGLAAGVAHEINTPLSAILQSLELVQRGFDPQNDQNKKIADRHDISLLNLHAYMAEKDLHYFIDGARQAAVTASEIIRNLLEFSRPRPGRNVPVDLKELIRTTLQLARADYELKKKYHLLDVDIVEEYASELPLVPCVSIEIEQVLLNLIKNALQAMAAQEGKQRRLTLRTEHIENTARIIVQDNGMGFDQETMKQIFDPFFTTKDVGEGTGLGLTIAYAIIHDKHQGKIEVSSTPGRGSTFTVILPLEADETNYEDGT